MQLKPALGEGMHSVLFLAIALSAANAEVRHDEEVVPVSFSKRVSKRAVSPPKEDEFVPVSFAKRKPAAVAASLDLRTAMNKCASCHAERDVLPFLRNPRALTAHMGAMTDTQLDKMVYFAKFRGLTEVEEHAVRDFVKRSRAIATMPVAVDASLDGCYMSADDRRRKIGAFPTVGGGSELASIVSAAPSRARMVFYDRTNVPRAWLESGINGSTGRIYSPFHHSNQDSFRNFGYHADGAREFPWAQTAGLDISPDGSADKFFIPPSSGRMGRFVARTRANSPRHFGDSTNVYGPDFSWIFNPGAIFGEVLKVAGVPFEVRLRQKMSNGRWRFDVLRPFESPLELAQGLMDLCEGPSAPPGCAEVEASGAIAKLQKPQTATLANSAYVNASTFGLPRDPLSLSVTALEALQPSAPTHVLPDLPEDIVRALLTTTPFKSVFNKPWIKGPPPGWAPTSNSKFNIVPNNYFGSHLPMTEQSCVKCHDSAGRSVDNFDPDPDRYGLARQMFFHDPTDARRPRTWYNKIPGDDGILSWHPWSADAVASSRGGDMSAVNPCLVRSGLFQ